MRDRYNLNTMPVGTSEDMLEYGNIVLFWTKCTSISNFIHLNFKTISWDEAFRHLDVFEVLLKIMVVVLPEASCVSIVKIAFLNQKWKHVLLLL